MTLDPQSKFLINLGGKDLVKTFRCGKNQPCGALQITGSKCFESSRGGNTVT